MFVTGGTEKKEGLKQALRIARNRGKKFHEVSSIEIHMYMYMVIEVVQYWHRLCLNIQVGGRQEMQGVANENLHFVDT